MSGAAHAIAAVFDLQHERADVCLMPDPETGEPINVSHMIPRSRADLERRHAGLQAIAEYTVGLMGRTPDYVNVTYAGFAGRDDEWSHQRQREGAANLVRYQKHMARADLSLTHAIIHPTVDRAQGAVPLGLDKVALHKVADTEHGIVVRGARVLATLAPFADEIAVYPAAPMPDANPAHALSFAIPMATPGLKFLCRDSVSVPGTLFDHPFSSRFDEQDAFVIFDNVEIPRERVFIDGNLAVYNGILRSSWWPNIMQQAMIRAETKLTFAWGIATRMAEAINASLPPALADAGRDLDLRRIRAFRHPCVAEVDALRVRQWRLVSRRAAADCLAHQPAALVSAGERDHPRTWLAQPADHADRRAIRRSGAAAAAG